MFDRQAPSLVFPMCILFCLLLVSGMALNARADDTNITLGKHVTLNGTFGVIRPNGLSPGQLAPASSVVDGVFLNRSRYWADNTIWWDATVSPGNSIEIDLSDGQGTEAYDISSFIVQADDNDEYILEYLDPTGVWKLAWAVPNYSMYGPGLQTRPSATDNTVRYILPTPITATKLRLSGNDANSDKYYSVSEIQAFGTKSRIQITVHDPTTEAEIAPVIEPSILRINLGINAWTQRRRQALLEIHAMPSTQLCVYLNAVDNTGGHQHTGNRPHGWFRKATQEWQNYPPYYGMSAYQEGGTLQYSTYRTAVQLTTDTQGNARLYYIASEIAGQEVVTVAFANPDPNKQFPTTKTLTLSNAKLQAFTGTSDIALTGSTTSHPYNHYGTATMIQAVTALARNYAAETPRGTLPTEPRLAVNDMSLESGGLFDIDADWLASHIGHRLGFEADMGGQNSGFGLVPGNTTFDRIVGEQGWFTAVPEGNPPHYHLVLTGTGKVTMAFPSSSAQWLDKSKRTLSVTVNMVNRGGLAATLITLTKIAATQGVAITSNLPQPVDGPIRVNRSFTVNVHVPQGVSGFSMSFLGNASASGAGQSFVVTGNCPVAVPQ